MKSRTSFFDKTVLRKDLTRFAPLWALYLIGGLLIAISIAAGSRPYYLAQAMNALIGPFSIISLCYAVLAAQLLFGDLFNTRLCNALHAMPLRREGWFLTHFTAGMLYNMVPNLLISLALMPFLGQFWYTALIWLLGMELHYLFFFGLAVFCMLLTGNRFAAAAVYAIINSLSAIVMWFCNTIYIPMLYGVVTREEPFARLCPVWGLCSHTDFFRIVHSENCACRTYNGYEDFYDFRCDYYFGGFGESWGYLIVLAALGIGLAVTALVLYRKRHLESAGDFMAFKGVKPVFTIIYTLCVGALLQIIGNLFDDPVYIFLVIGLIIGYFTSQMLLNRTLRVFKKKNWLSIVLILVLMFSSLGLCRIDAFGFISWTPDAEDVVSVKVADVRVSQFTDYNIDAELTDKQNIETIISIHKLLYAEGPTDSRHHYDGLQNVTLCYTLKDGREIYRQYRATKGGEAEKAINDFLFHTPSFILKVDSLQQLQQKTDHLWVNDIEVTDERRQQLLQALWADVEAGTLELESKWDNNHVGYVQISLTNGNYIYLDIFEKNTHTSKWIKESLLHGLSASELQQHVSWILIEGKELVPELPDFDEFCYLFALDNQNGLIPEGKQDTGIPVELNFYNGLTAQFTVTEEAVNCYPWILEYLEMK